MEFIMMFMDCPQPGLDVIFRIINAAIRLICLFVPILLIIFGSLDMAKCVIAGKEDEMKKFQNAFIKRLLYAAVVFLIPFIVTFVTGFLANNGEGTIENTNDWRQCLDAFQ